MITKRNGNGQTECIGCKEKNKNMPLTWDSWLYTFNGEPYCQECLFEMLEDLQQRIDTAIELITKLDFDNYVYSKRALKELKSDLLLILQGDISDV